MPTPVMKRFLHDSDILQAPATQGKARHQGFALIVAITLMGFILLLILSLSSMVAVETKSADYDMRKMRAQQNALFALKLAMGNLQRYAGPDQRVTARADIIDPDSNNGTAANEVDYWTGVWSTDPDDASGTNPADIKNEDPIAWLTSEPAPTSASDLPDQPKAFSPGANSVVLFDNTKTGETDRDVELTKQDIDGGAYAWWVSDDGIKASVRYYDYETSPSLSSNINYFAPKRMAMEINPDLADFANYGANLQDYWDAMGNIFDYSQLDNIAADTAVTTEKVREFDADFTLDARSLLTNVRDGGLKKDLTAGFDSDFSDLVSDFGSNQMFPPQGGGLSFMDTGGPYWEQLKSFYDLSGVGSSILPRKQVDDQMGVYPVVSHFSMHQHVLIYESPSLPDTYIPRFCTVPMVVLWNPYNVRLSATTYYMAVRYFNVEKYDQWIDIYCLTDLFPSVTDPGNPGIHDANHRVGLHSETNHVLRFELPNVSLEPGEAAIFTLKDDVQPAQTGASDFLEMEKGKNTGHYFYAEGGAFTLDPSEVINEIVMTAEYKNQTRVSLALREDELDEDTDTYLQDVLIGNYWMSPTHFGPGSSGQKRGITMSWDFDRSDALNASDMSAPLIPGGPWDDGVSFPLMGIFGHLKMLKNHAAVNFFGAGGSVQQVKTLANYNPRASRSSQSPMEGNNIPGNMRFNPIYFFNTEYYDKDSGGGNSGGVKSLPTDDQHSYYLFSHGATETYLGKSDVEAEQVNTNNGWVLFDLPRDEGYFQSVGNLMHANLTQRYSTYNQVITKYQNVQKSASADQNYWPSYAIGNSLPDPRIHAGETYRDAWPNGSGTEACHYDISYLLNDILWDDYFFSSYDGSNDFYNPRVIPLDSTDYPLNYDLEETATSMMIGGGFNVNSTSVDAWKAFLAGTLGTEVRYNTGSTQTFQDDTQSVFLRTSVPRGADTGDARDQETPEIYNGFLTMSDLDIQVLAEKIVEQVKQRGPFISMNHFVNRALHTATNLSSKEVAYLGGYNPEAAAVDGEKLSGPLQTAIYKSLINEAAPAADGTPGGGAARFNDPTYELSESESAAMYADLKAKHAAGDLATANPGYLTQADILAQIGSLINVRSDTFTIRAYGESTNPVTGEVEASAYCSAVVQRFPNYMDSSADDPEDIPAAGSFNDTFGRKFELLSFRWLAPNEI